MGAIHGYGPKIVWVGAYVQKRGKGLTYVRSHSRTTPYPYFCMSPNQLNFGFHRTWPASGGSP